MTAEQEISRLLSLHAIDPVQAEELLARFWVDVRREVLVQASDRLYNIFATGEGNAWNWHDAATIPESCGQLIDPRTP